MCIYKDLDTRRVQATNKAVSQSCAVAKGKTSGGSLDNQTRQTAPLAKVSCVSAKTRLWELLLLLLLTSLKI